jgi:hypothetical protein
VLRYEQNAACGHRLLAKRYAALGAVIFSMTESRLKLAGFWRGGNSLKLEIHCPTIAWAGTSRNARSIIHLL